MKIHDIYNFMVTYTYTKTNSYNTPHSQCVQAEFV